MEDDPLAADATDRFELARTEFAEAVGVLEAARARVAEAEVLRRWVQHLGLEAAEGYRLDNPRARCCRQPASRTPPAR